MEDSNGQPLAMGSGFVIKDGIVATNLHVVEGASQGYAKLADRKDKFNISGTVATDPARDIVLLAVEGLQAPALALGDSTQVAVGDEVYAVGNPRGLEGTFSAGIISSVRKVGDDTFLQITAPISPGSSGGPVVNAKGEVVGMSVATFKGGQNLNFAIPSSYLTTLMTSTTKPVKFAQVPPQAIMVPAPAPPAVMVPRAIPRCVNALVLHMRFPLIDTTEGVFEARPNDFLDVGHRYLLVVAEQRIVDVLELPGSDNRSSPLVAKLAERCAQDCREKGCARGFSAAADCEDKEVIRLGRIATEYDAKAAAAVVAAGRAAAAKPAADAKFTAAAKVAADAKAAADYAADVYRVYVQKLVDDANASPYTRIIDREMIRWSQGEASKKAAVAKAAAANEAAAAAYRREIDACIAAGAESSGLRTAADDFRAYAAAAALNAARYRAAVVKAAAVEPDR